MKIFRYILLAVLGSIVIPLSLFGQDRSDEEIIKEYERWSKVKNDWPNLARYQDANSKLKAPAPDEKRIVFMGNSITEGWVKASPEFFEGKPYVGRGISGQTTPQMLVRFRQDVIDLDPYAVVILAGTNDIAGNTGPSTFEMITGNIASMAELAAANNIKVILASILPAYDYPWRPGLEPAEKIIAINKWIQNYCEENEMIYLDYFSSMADERNGLQSELTYDGVHPDKDGYKVMARLAEEAILKSMESK